MSAATRALVEPLLGTGYVTRAVHIKQWWSESEDYREAWRDEALGSILRYAIERVPAYRECRPVIDDFPVVDKQTMMAEPERYLSDEHDSIPVVEKHTGGSTGDPWTFPLDRRAWAESYATQIFRFGQLGVAYGDKRLLLGFPASLRLQGLGPTRRLRLIAERTDASLCGFEIDPSASLTRAERAATTGARLWYGYASTIATMASAVLDADRQLPGPHLIVTMAEPLMPAWRDDIVEAFGSPVVEEYGCNDGGAMAHRCSSGNLHLADHQSLVEVLDDDGRPCPPGRDGAIVITNFHARHLPFIRYRVGDIGALGPDPCPCGQPGRSLSRVTGRTGDFVKLPDGTELTPAAFFVPFNEATGVRRWQIVQPDRQRLVVRIEAREGFDDGDRALILKWVEDRTRHQLAVDLTETAPFELTRGGKHRIVIRRF
ncbi:MAG: phenylacetate--CoA ligase family protein [Acidimicrobiales bacterium]